MRYRTIQRGKAWIARVEDGEGGYVEAPAASPEAAAALHAKAKAEGMDSIRTVIGKVKKLLGK